MIAQLAALTMLFGGSARIDETDIPLDKVPAKALAAVQKLFPNAKLVEATFDTVDGVEEYTIGLHQNKAFYEVTVTADGKVLEIAREITLKDAPKPVSAAFHKMHPKAKVEGVWELTEPGVKGKTYQIDFRTADGKEMTVDFDADGKVIP